MYQSYHLSIPNTKVGPKEVWFRQISLYFTNCYNQTCIKRSPLVFKDRWPLKRGFNSFEIFYDRTV